MPGSSCGEQIRSCECRCATYDSFVSNVVILVLLVFLCWKILEISSRYKLINRCCFQPEQNFEEEFEYDMRPSSLRRAKTCPIEFSDDSNKKILNHPQMIENRTNEKDGDSEKTGTPFCKKCELLLGKGFRNCSTGVHMQDLIEECNGESDFGRENLDGMKFTEIKTGYDHEDGYELDSAALKRAIRIEQGYRAVAYLELDKERKAAATAAHDAMVMILRLQNEKSMVDLQLRQCRREAKQRELYDQEVIASLEENVSRIELEKKALEYDELAKKKFLQNNGVEVNSHVSEKDDFSCKYVLANTVSTDATGEDDHALGFGEGSKNSFKLSHIINGSVPFCVS